MNVSKLLELINFLLQKENEHHIQERLKRIEKLASKMTNQPHNGELKNAILNEGSALQNSYEQLRSSFDPAKQHAMHEIGADLHFLKDFVTGIVLHIQNSSFVALSLKEYVERIQGERDAFLISLVNLKNSLRSLNFEENVLPPGEAEIGFLLPRALFNNNFDNLIDELSELKFIIRAFSEVSTGHVEEVKVCQISTSDPIFFLNASAVTILLLGKSVSWALDMWKKIEEIRSLRAQTRKVINDDAIDSIFEKTIKDLLNTNREQIIDELMARCKDETSRKHELRNHVEAAINSILARVERGMVVEIKFSPAETNTDDADASNNVSAQLDELQQKMMARSFPKGEQTEYLLPLTKSFTEHSQA